MDGKGFGSGEATRFVAIVDGLDMMEDGIGKKRLGFDRICYRVQHLIWLLF